MSESETIELQTFALNSNSDDDIEEYHEISENVLSGPLPSGSILSRTYNDYDFFTQYEVKPVQDENFSRKPKKKKCKKKGKKNLMDLISTELASMATPVEKNVITMEQYNKDHSKRYLEIASGINVFVSKSKYGFSENESRWRKNSKMNLIPTFPKVLENITTENYLIPVQYVEPIMYNDIIANFRETDSKQYGKFLDITVKDIKLTYHHLLSLEELLCIKLIEYYDQFTNIQSVQDNLKKDIKIQRQVKKNLKEELSKITSKDDLRFDQTMRKYTAKLINLKKEYLQTLQAKKEVIHKLMSIWYDIEMVREKTHCIKTPYVLEMEKTVENTNEAEEEWNNIFEIEFSDLLDEIEFDYVTKYIEYREEKNNTKRNNSEARKRNKPKLNIDETDLKEKVEKNVRNIIKDNELKIYMKIDKNILSNPEKLGFNREYYFEVYIDDVFVCESKYFISNKDKLHLTEFEESFSIQILTTNTTLEIVLNENNEKVSSIKINLLELKFNDRSDFKVDKFVSNKIIAPNHKHVGSGYHIKDIAAENKVRLRSSSAFKGKLYTTYAVNIKLDWNDNVDTNRIETIKESMEIGRQLKRLMEGALKPNINILKDLVEKIYRKNIDDNANMINIFRELCKKGVKFENGFSVDDTSPEFARVKLLHLRNKGGFSGIENKLVPIHASQITTEQLNCLQKSNENEFDIQRYDKYIDTDPLELQRFISAKYVHKLNKNTFRNLNEYLVKKTHKDVVRDFKDLSLRSLFTIHSSVATLATLSSSTKQQMLHQSLAQDQQIRITIFRAFNLVDRRVFMTEDDECEEEIVGFKVHPLRPYVKISYHRNAVHTATAIGCHPTWNQTVLINTRLEPLSTIDINVFDECKVNINDAYPDDEQSLGKTVHYRYYNKWLGTLQVPLYTVLRMGTVRGTFKITTPPLVLGYENVSQDKSQSLITRVTQLLKNDSSFLSLQITTTLCNLSGLQGYNQPVPCDPEDDCLIKHLNEVVTEYTNEFPSRNISLTFIDSSGKNRCVTQFLQPIITPAANLFPKSRKMRSESALSKSSGLSKSSSSRNSSKNTLFLTNKDRDVERGSSMNEEDQKETEKESIYSVYEESRGTESQLKAMSACSRYVSLIPTYEVTENHVVALSGLELLKVVYGSPLDHTILLCSYFMYLGIECYVAVGRGLPRGPSTYVLTRYDRGTRRMVLVDEQSRSKGIFNKEDGVVWYVHDAVNGERYEMRDISCPLDSVDYVFDNENIWLNVQSSVECQSMSFDLSRSSDWQTVFDKTNFLSILPCVSDHSIYSAPPDVDRLQQILEAKIKAKIQKWRPHMKTIWNKYCSNLLREMLPHWEYWSFNSTEPKPGFTHRFKQLMATYKMFGFPLNLAYTNTKSIIASVKCTGVHANDDPGAEFGLGVQLFAYPNNVISVWVYIATIIRV